MNHIVPQGKTGGWSVTGDLRTGDIAKQVSLQCNFPVADVYTVEFNLNRIVPAALNFTIVRAEAIIKWSVEGNDVTRRVTVGNGVSVTGVGAACKVTIIDATVVVGGETASYNVSAQVSRGTRGPDQEPPTLEGPRTTAPEQVTLLPGASFVWPIPQDAGVISVAIVVGRSGPGSLPILDQEAKVEQRVGVIPIKTYDARACCWVPVTMGATNIRVTNQSIADTFFAQCTFGING